MKPPQTVTREELMEALKATMDRTNGRNCQSGFHTLCLYNAEPDGHSSDQEKVYDLKMAADFMEKAASQPLDFTY